ncbi:DNRLRE domain-containing protein [Saccharomonospora sp. NB11]|uniref:DNRLRE domain-containing protein n=1 Tax=Saccharomonospora sp. NB11 TaxID=1642298 RepID=UPI0018D1EC88|nr:DNRLRE domain-containing protein [Saccharomonospora sp. NB11]
MTVHPVTQSWSVSGKKSYPGPSYGSSIAEKSFAYGHSSACSSRWVTIDLGEKGRDLLHGWTHGKPNHGLAVRASTTDSKAWKKFASVASANAPYLEVTSTPYWATYQVGDLISPVSTTDDGIMRVTVKNAGKDTWTPTNGYELGYRIWDAEGNELPYNEWAVDHHAPQRGPGPVCHRRCARQGATAGHVLGALGHGTSGKDTLLLARRADVEARRLLRTQPDSDDRVGVTSEQLQRDHPHTDLGCEGSGS